MSCKLYVFHVMTYPVESAVVSLPFIVNSAVGISKMPSLFTSRETAAAAVGRSVAFSSFDSGEMSLSDASSYPMTCVSMRPSAFMPSSTAARRQEFTCEKLAEV